MTGALPLRPQAGLAEEIGQRVINACDHLKAFAPELEAQFPFHIDGTDFSLTIRMEAK